MAWPDFFSDKSGFPYIPKPLLSRVCHASGELKKPRIYTQRTPNKSRAGLYIAVCSHMTCAAGVLCGLSTGPPHFVCHICRSCKKYVPPSHIWCARCQIHSLLGSSEMKRVCTVCNVSTEPPAPKPADPLCPTSSELLSRQSRPARDPLQAASRRLRSGSRSGMTRIS